MKKIILTMIIGTTLLCACSTKNKDMKLNLFATVPSSEQGFEKGVSACYAAVYNDTLYITGGCNFPEKPVTEGGAKRYYKSIFSIGNVETRQSHHENKQDVIDTSQEIDGWKKVGEMPMSSAYGANIQCDNRWIIAGGMNENGATKKVICINLDDNCSIENLPDLPFAIDNTSGAAANGKIFVVGGNADGKASNMVFVLDLNNVKEGWKMLAAMPSRGRVQPVCTATEDALFVWGGFSPADENGEAVAYSDGMRYDFNTDTWTTLPDVVVDGERLTFTGASMTLVNETLLVAGGVNREIFTDAISGRYELVDKADYMHKEPEWYKFNKYLMEYDLEKGSWKAIDTDKNYARAGALLLASEKGLFYICGELKPGIRTAEIFKLKIES